MVPDYVNFNGWFNPQKPLSVSHPDFMREVGFASTGGYPIEQAPWMAGPPIPDFMELGGADNALGGGCCGWNVIGLTRNPKTGFYAMTDYGYAKSGLGYYSIPSVLDGLGATVAVDLKKAESKEAYDFSQRVENVSSKAAAASLLRYGRAARDRLSSLSPWTDSEWGYYNWYYSWKKNMDLYTNGLNQLTRKFGPFTENQVQEAQVPIAPPKKSIIEKAVATLDPQAKKDEEIRRQEEEKFKRDEAARVHEEIAALILEADKSLVENPEVSIAKYKKVLDYDLPALGLSQFKRIAEMGISRARDAGNMQSKDIITASQLSDQSQILAIKQAIAASGSSSGSNKKILAASLIGGSALLAAVILYKRKR